MHTGAIKGSVTPEQYRWLYAQVGRWNIQNANRMRRAIVLSAHDRMPAQKNAAVRAAAR